MGSKARQPSTTRINGLPQPVRQRAFVEVVSGGKQRTLSGEELVEMLGLEGLQLVSSGDTILLRNQFASPEVNGTMVHPARNLMLRGEDTLKLQGQSGPVHCRVISRT